MIISLIMMMMMMIIIIFIDITVIAIAIAIFIIISTIIIIIIFTTITITTTIIIIILIIVIVIVTIIIITIIRINIIICILLIFIIINVNISIRIILHYPFSLPHRLGSLAVFHQINVVFSIQTQSHVSFIYSPRSQIARETEETREQLPFLPPEAWCRGVARVQNLVMMMMMVVMAMMVMMMMMRRRRRISRFLGQGLPKNISCFQEVQQILEEEDWEVAAAWVVLWELLLGGPIRLR
jgi:hypothetical protein